MSDGFGIRMTIGNSWSHIHHQEQSVRYHGRRRLVEECEIVRVEAVQRAFGRKALLAAIRQARPLRWPITGGFFDVWFVDVFHRLPGKIERWSSWEDGNTRIWLMCPRCWKKVGNLYFYFLPGSSGLSELWCRKCHDLTYQSINCGGNLWYRTVARPMKRLLKDKERLRAKKPTPLILARLTQLERQMQVLRERARPKAPPRSPSWSSHVPAVRQRRRYRDLSLIGDEMGNECVARPNAPTSHRSKPVGQRKPLLRERKTVEMTSVAEAVRQAELRLVLKLLPALDNAVRELERSPEWAGSPKLADAKQTLERIRLLGEQNATEPK